MKKQIMIVALMVASVIAFAGLASTAQAVPDYDHEIVTGQTSGSGNVWQFKTGDAFPSFSGNQIDIDSIVVTYYFTDTPLVPHTLEPKNKVVNGNHVSIVFDPSDLKDIQDEVAVTTITGTLDDGLETFRATGPGFAWGRRR